MSIDLYMQCFSRFKEDTAEEYLINIITHLKRETGERVDRYRVQDDIMLNRGLDKYENELKTILKLDDEHIDYLTAKTMDFADELTRLKNIEAIFKKTNIITSRKQVNQLNRLIEHLQTILETSA